MSGIKYNVFSFPLKKAIRTGKSSARTVLQLINSSEVLQTIQESHPELLEKRQSETSRTKTDVENHIAPIKMTTFKRNIQRKLDDLESEQYVKGEARLIKSRSSSGKNLYYWVSDEARNDALGFGEISEKRYEARMLIFRFIDAYFHSFIPPTVFECLREDLREAQFDYHTWEDKLRFLPQGLNTTIKHLEHSFNGVNNENTINNINDDLTQVFNALDKNIVFSASYDSLHKNTLGNEFVLSPQRIEYLNQKVLLLAYMHDSKKYKRFQIDRLKNVKHLSKPIFKEINWSQYEQSFDFDFRAHDWVANSLEASGFGLKTSTKSDKTGLCRIKGQIAFPKHFIKDAPDIFDCVNFLSHYGDALEVLKPVFLREEMKRRATNTARLYSSEELTEEKAYILQSSAAEQ